MTLRLLTIGPSHYCEKARWALDYAGVPFVEDSHVPMVHWAFSLPSGSRTVPVLMGAEKALSDSSDILAFADARAPSHARLYPEDPDERARVLRLEDLFDETLGPLTRRIVYCFLVPRPELFVKTFESSAPTLERLALKRAHGLLRTALGRAFKVSARAEAQSIARTEALFAEVATTLGTNRYLVGDRFSAADLTFAALASPILLPDELPFLHRTDLPPEIGVVVDRFRESRAGQHALDVYRRHRRPPKATEGSTPR